MVRRGLELCILCCESPCVCNKDAKPVRRPKSTQNRSTGGQVQIPPTARADPVSPTQPQQPANPWDADDPPPPTHAMIMQHQDDIDFARAIQVLNDAGLIHPDDGPKTPAERAVLWREAHS